MAKNGTQPSVKSDKELQELRTAKDKLRLLAALERTMGVVTTACRNAKISRDTHYRWLKEDKEYNRKYKEIDDVALDFSESKMFERIEEGDSGMIKFHLQARGRKRGYTKRVEFEEVNEFKEKFREDSPEEIHAKLQAMLKKMTNAVE